MAVQKSKKTRSRRGMRRSHDALNQAMLSIDPVSGEKHLRHQMTQDGFYKGKLIKDLRKKVKTAEDSEESE
tara:strand:+ start:305 stop:517 length:213 start_codon:yes stop_codon:yes gene_type:complete